jgi:hypothetical protein
MQSGIMIFQRKDILLLSTESGIAICISQRITVRRKKTEKKCGVSFYISDDRFAID